jgi:hypothetical protein
VVDEGLEKDDGRTDSTRRLVETVLLNRGLDSYQSVAEGEPSLMSTRTWTNSARPKKSRGTCSRTTSSSCDRKVVTIKLASLSA